MSTTRGLRFHPTLVAASVAAAIATIAHDAAAQAVVERTTITQPTIVERSDASRYVTTNQGNVVVSGTGLCVETGSWTPGTSVAGCDPLPRRVAAAPEPQPEPPAPAAAAPAEPVAPPQQLAEPAPAPMPEKLSLSTDALFNFDKSDLRPDAKAELDNLLERMRASNVDEINLVGHTDSIGTDEYNQKLSERRADAVKAYLVSQGMPAEKIHTEGRGEREPIADNKTKEGRQENRRVDVAVAGTTTQPQVVGQTPSESTTTTQ
jgi:OOP family OmpA-OmpF porin